MESSLLILHVSDTHLGHRQYGLYERERDVYDVFHEVVELAERERVDVVVHAGDFFDSTRPPPQAYHHAIEGLRRLTARDIPVVVVPGDHDIPRRLVVPPLLVLENIGLLKVVGLRGNSKTVKLRTPKGREIMILGIRNYKGHAARQRLLAELRSFAARPHDTPSVIILHQTLGEAAPNPELYLGELPKGHSYYAMGHLHVAKVFQLGEAKVVYPGSTEALRVDEAEVQQHRYVALAEIARTKTLSLNLVKLERARPQPVLKLRYRGLEELKRELARFVAGAQSRPDAKKPLLHVRLEGVPPDAKNAVLQALEGLRGRVLDYRAHISVARTVQTRAGAIVSTLNIEELLKAYLGDEKLAALAYELLEVLGSEKEADAVNQAQRIVEEVLIEGHSLDN